MHTKQDDSSLWKKELVQDTVTEIIWQQIIDPKRWLYRAMKNGKQIKPFRGEMY